MNRDHDSSQQGWKCVASKLIKALCVLPMASAYPRSAKQYVRKVFQTVRPLERNLPVPPMHYVPTPGKINIIPP